MYHCVGRSMGKASNVYPKRGIQLVKGMHIIATQTFDPNTGKHWLLI